MRDAAVELLEAAGRLPRLAARAERVLDGLEDGVRIAPGSLEGMTGRGGRGGGALPLLLVLVAGLLAALLAVQLL